MDQKSEVIIIQYGTFYNNFRPFGINGCQVWYKNSLYLQEQVLIKIFSVHLINTKKSLNEGRGVKIMDFTFTLIEC